MSMPFFSIVIPTRDRPQLILETAISAKAQQFDNFEVILSDNSSDDATRDQLHSSPHLSGIAYVRPPTGLSMPDHWEFATLQAKGQYVLVLTDRSVLKQGALAAIARAIHAHGSEAIQACSWRWSLFDDELGIEFAGNCSSDIEVPLGTLFDSKAVAMEFVDLQQGYPYKLPRALNSCYNTAIAARIRARHGKLFHPLSPDFTSAFLMLAHASKMLYIDAPLFVSRGLSSSTGGNSYLTSHTMYLEESGLKDWYRYVPIKVALVENLLVQDFLAMQDMAGGGLQVEMNWVEYFVRCYKEILGKRGQGALNGLEVDVLEREWTRALADMEDSIQRQVRMKKESLRGLKLRAAIRQIPFGTGAIAAFRRLKRSFGRKPTTVLQAAGFDLRDNVAFGGTPHHQLTGS